MATNHEPTAKAEAKNTSIRKVNLSDLTGSLHQRGRQRYDNPNLANAMRELLTDRQPFIWEDAKPEGKTDKAKDASKAKWRNRAVSVMSGIDPDAKLTIRWTTQDEMVILLADK